MFLLSKLKSRLARFSQDESGSIMIEAVMTLPLLFLVLAASYEFFEVHRYTSARDKATYTIADMLSREMAPVDDLYIDNTKVLFDAVANDNGNTQLRVSVIKYDADDDEYEIKWSEVRGTGDMSALTTPQVRNNHATLPTITDGEEFILIETTSLYSALFEVGLKDQLEITTRVITSPRFAPQIVWQN